MDRAVKTAVGTALDSQITSQRPLSGGDINDAYAVTLDDGREVFVKTNRRADPKMFPAEATGLQWLDIDAIRIPEVLAVSSADSDGPHFLALEMLRPKSRQPRFDEDLGRGLAELHRAGADRFGLDHDNFLAVLEQDNTPCDSWAEFYVTKRLEPLLRRAIDRGQGPRSMAADLDGVFTHIEELVGPPEPPARLHGDLWGGNLHVDDSGNPCLIDPAVYGGHREIDLAMMRLFGGFSARCFAAYDEAFPLAPGHEQRVPLYQLYPLLAHVNLFGGGYVGSVHAAVLQLR